MTVPVDCDCGLVCRQVRRCWLGLVSALCARRPRLVVAAAARLAPAVMHGLHEQEPSVLSDTWDAAISVASTVPVSGRTPTPGPQARGRPQRLVGVQSDTTSPAIWTGGVDTVWSVRSVPGRTQNHRR